MKPKTGITTSPDNSPLPEVYTAAFCGLAVVGDNGF